MTVTDRLLPIVIAMLSVAGVFVGFNGDGGLHKVLLIFCGMVHGFLIDYVFTGDKS